MDEASRNTTAFLGSLQDAMRKLADVSNHYQRRGARPDKPYLVLGARPFRVHDGPTVREFHGSLAIGLNVRGTDGRNYDLGIDVLWDATCWTLTTEAWVESDDGGEQLLRELPERNAPTLEACTRHLAEAVSDLIRFDDLVPPTNASGLPLDV
jgi:hypothetical protein